MSICGNHQQCIDAALSSARAICEQQKVRLTPLRQSVFLLIWQSHKPLGAYELIDRLACETQRPIAPPTVYRTLEFLLDQGLIHRIHSLNAYIGCPYPKAHQADSQRAHYFFICRVCHIAEELIDSAIVEKIDAAGKTVGFGCEQQWLEVTGLCQQCQQVATNQ